MLRCWPACLPAGCRTLGCSASCLSAYPLPARLARGSRSAPVALHALGLAREQPLGHLGGDDAVRLAHLGLRVVGWVGGWLVGWVGEWWVSGCVDNLAVPLGLTTASPQRLATVPNAPSAASVTPSVGAFPIRMWLAPALGPLGISAGPLSPPRTILFILRCARSAILTALLACGASLSPLPAAGGAVLSARPRLMLRLLLLCTRFFAGALLPSASAMSTSSPPPPPRCAAALALRVRLRPRLSSRSRASAAEVSMPMEPRLLRSRAAVRSGAPRCLAGSTGRLPAAAFFSR